MSVCVATGLAMAIAHVGAPSVALADRSGKRVKKHAGKMLRKARRYRRVRAPKLQPSPFLLRFAPGVSQEDRLKRRISYVSRSPVLRRATTAVLIKDAISGKVLYSAHATEKLNPASNVKLIATAAVLDTLGPDWRYSTRLFGPTPNRDGVAKGDIYLRGNHDPTLRTKGLEDLAATLAAQGVTEIDGDLVIGNGRRDGFGRPWVWIKVRGGNKAGDPVTVKVGPESDFIKLEVTATTSTKRWPKTIVRTSVVTNEAGASQLRIEIAGKVRRRTLRRFRRWVPARALYTAHTLRRALTDVGITHKGTVREQSFPDYVAAAGKEGFIPVELAVHRSKPMRELVATVNKRSLNWLADGIVMTAGAFAFGGEPNMRKGVKVMHRWLAKQAHIKPSNLVVDTGSGLSYATELTAQQIVRVLRVAGGYADVDDEPEESDHDELEKVFRRSLSVAGVDGTLRGRYKKSMVRGKMIGKTGTLRNAVATSGVVHTASGRALAFSIVTNGTPWFWRWQVRREHDWMVKSMYDYLAKSSRARKAVRTAARGR